MKAYRMSIAGVAVTVAMKHGELRPVQVTHRRAAPAIPGTTLYGAYHYLHGASLTLNPEELEQLCTECRFYPALPAADFSHGENRLGCVDATCFTGVFTCEKSTCIYVDYVALAAFSGPKRGALPPSSLHVGIYIDRRTKTAKYGAIYSYQYYKAGSYVFASEADMPKRPMYLGYKKTYGLGRAEVKDSAPTYPVASRRHILLSPVPLDALEAAGVTLVASTLKYTQPYYVYIMYTNKFYRLGDGPTAAPGTIVEVDHPTTAPALWKKISQEVEKLKLEGTKNTHLEKCIKKKAASTAAAPVAYVD